MKSKNCRIFDKSSFEEQFLALSRQALRDFSFESPPYKMHFDVIKEVMKFAIDPQGITLTQISQNEFLCQPQTNLNLDDDLFSEKINTSEVQVQPFIASSVFD